MGSPGERWEGVLGAPTLVVFGPLLLPCRPRHHLPSRDLSGPHLVCLSSHPPPGLPSTSGLLTPLSAQGVNSAFPLSRCVGVLDTTVGLTGASARTLRPGEGGAVEQMFRRQRGVFRLRPSPLVDSGQWFARSQRSVQTQTMGPLPLHLSSTQDSGLSKSHLF